jgi:hypothetical protein
MSTTDELSGETSFARYPQSSGSRSIINLHFYTEFKHPGTPIDSTH